MMSRAPRWPESPLDSKAAKPTQRAEVKHRASSAAPASRAGKQAGNSKAGDAHGRSRSLSRRTSDTSGDSQGQHITRQASGRTARSGMRLCSSRSFSSLHTSSLSAAPFMRSSRSLSRLDQTSSSDDGVKLQRALKKACSYGQLSSSGDDTREDKETMKASGSSESSSSLRSATDCKKIKKQTRDGVHTLCAMTSGMRRNLVQTVLKNVRPSPAPSLPSSCPVEETISLKPQQRDPRSAEEAEKGFVHKPGDGAEEPNQEEAEGEQTCADGGSEMPATAPLNEGEAESCDDAQTSRLPSSQRRTVKKRVETDRQSGERRASLNLSWDGVKASRRQLCEQQTVQLMKELEQTQRELSRLQQLNTGLQAELQQERKSRPQNDGFNQDQAQYLRLQRTNHDLRSELETLKREQEEAREAELRRRVDLLAQQAQLLVTGDATALAQVQLEQDRHKFFELQGEWERCIASLQSQLDISEEQKKEAQSSRAKLQLELECFRSINEENKRLQEQVGEVALQLSTKEEAQAQKEALLEKHLALLQASQDRERRSLATSLKQAEQHVKDLQERLEMAEEQVLNMNKTEAWSMEMERAKEELQEELRCAGSDVKKVQEEREQLRRRCQELQNQLSDTDREVGQLESRLKTKEMHNYSLQSSYEKVCKELQGALRKVQQKDAETQDMQEGYKRLLDRKEQELCEVLLKMEILGNSLEETEVKLNELLNSGSSTSSQLKDEPSEPERQSERHGSDVPDDPHWARITSCSSDSTYPDFSSAGEDQERFVSVIQILESKLFLTEEKLRDIMQRLEEHQSDVSGQDPTLCSQLTQSRASSQHLSLLLHTQAKKNQRFAQETETCCRLLVGRFQVALNIIQACRGRLQLAPADTVDFEKQLATVAACLQQGERDAERHKRESRSVSKAEEKILSEEPAAAAGSSSGAGSVQSYLKNEIFVVGHMVSALQSEHGVAELFSLAPRGDEEGVATKFKSVISQRIHLKTRGECDTNAEVNGSVSRACADAELVYSALMLQRQLQSQRKSPAGVSRPELAQRDQVGNALRGAAAEADVVRVEVDREPGWLGRLLSGLKMRVTGLQQLAQEICENSGAQRDVDEAWKDAPVADLNWILEEARLIYLSERLKLDFEQEGKGRDFALKDEQETWKQSVYGPGEDGGRLGEELESPEGMSQKILKDVEEINAFHEKRLRKLQKEFEERVTELQQIHGDELKHLHEEQKGGGDAAEHEEKPQASCNDDASELEDKHVQLIQDLQRQHDREVAALLREKDGQLQKETAATLTAIATMRRAHNLEPGENLRTRENAGVRTLPDAHGSEVQGLQQELEALSLQHGQKCLENSQLNQQLQDQRQALKQCQNQIQELQTKQRDEISEAQLPNGKQAPGPAHTADRYEMEVVLRAREAEMQFLRQEAHSLKEELKIARMDKIYAQNKLKALYTKSQDDTSNLRDTFKFGTWSPTRGASGQSAEAAGAKTSSAASLKKPEKPSLLRHIRAVRSKSLKDGLSAQERMTLFDSI